MPITPELLDQLLKDYKSPEEMFGHDGLLQQLTKAVVERALQGEMTHHLGMKNTHPKETTAATLAMANPRKPFAANGARSRSRCRGIATLSSSRN